MNANNISGFLPGTIALKLSWASLRTRRSTPTPLPSTKESTSLSVPSIYTMPAKGKAADKGKAPGGGGKGKVKAKNDGDEKSGGGKLKAANSINVRHILVCGSTVLLRGNMERSGWADGSIVRETF
jgi:hypothetical protein